MTLRRGVSHKKTDKIDSEFIAQLALNDMVKPSRVFPKFHREFRSYVRLRHNLVRKRTDIKNQAHAILSSEMFHLNDVLTDIFGKNGRMVGQTSYLNRFLITCLSLIQHIDEQISNLETQLFNYAYKHHKHEMDILMSCPGIGEISAATLIAEIGDFNDFSSGDKLASWLGIVPNVYQSADKYHNGRITKRGSKVARWMLTQVAQAASRKKASKLKEFFNRKKKTIGYQKAIIALARKIVTIIWHLIKNNEMYEDETGYQKGEIQKRKIVETAEISIDERISIISEIFAIVNKKNTDVT